MSTESSFSGNDAFFIDPDAAWAFGEEEREMMKRAGFSFGQVGRSHPHSEPVPTIWHQATSEELTRKRINFHAWAFIHAILEGGDSRQKLKQFDCSQQDIDVAFQYLQEKSDQVSPSIEVAVYVRKVRDALDALIEDSEVMAA